MNNNLHNSSLKRLPSTYIMYLQNQSTIYYFEIQPPILSVLIWSLSTFVQFYKLRQNTDTFFKVSFEGWIRFNPII